MLIFSEPNVLLEMIGALLTKRYPTDLVAMSSSEFQALKFASSLRESSRR